jgi:hypothetical protein
VRALALAVLLAACAPQTQLEAAPPDCDGMPLEECSRRLDAFASAHEYPGLRECLSGVTVYRAPDVAAMVDACIIDHAPEQVLCCTFEWGEGYVIAVRADVDGELFDVVFDHELRHRASACVFGDDDAAHAGEFFPGQEFDHG